MKLSLSLLLLPTLALAKDEIAYQPADSNYSFDKAALTRFAASAAAYTKHAQTALATEEASLAALYNANLDSLASSDESWTGWMESMLNKYHHKDNQLSSSLQMMGASIDHVPEDLDLTDLDVEPADVKSM